MQVKVYRREIRRFLIFDSKLYGEILSADNYLILPTKLCRWFHQKVGINPITYTCFNGLPGIQMTKIISDGVEPITRNPGPLYCSA